MTYEPATANNNCHTKIVNLEEMFSFFQLATKNYFTKYLNEMFSYKD